ncbi:MAG TPA: DUF5916 domain-containing protein [Bacteroidia bacterium]|nr:DUF5916 domain-containing protein [Bacteroidia bacterium]
MIKYILASLLLWSFLAFGNDTTKVSVASRITEAPKIDGVLNEPCWANISAVSDFIMNRPLEGGTPTQKTEVKIAYDNKAIYVAAMLFDTHPDSILHELGNRDDGLNADFFRFVIDPYNLRQDAFDFGVYASGVQADSKFTDPTFNAVWESAVKIQSQGWSVEMKIPYSAIRFPKKPIQEWAFQTTRSIKRNQEFDQWSLTPSTAANSQVYWGVIRGIQDIQSPPRLSITPYASGYFERSPDYASETEYHYSNSVSYNIGADLKYGIDDRFTLDMTLLPDFGQTQSDNKVKNLSYREINYNENRSFFKEGTELFSKNSLFYSRRIGKTPTFFYSVMDSLKEGETIEDNPSQVKLINSFKISGRSNSGLGFGLFNALTNSMYAELQAADGSKRRVLTEPLTNYNVLVLDQQINDYSNFYFINTNVTRDKKYNDANVSGTGFTFADKNNRYAVDGSFALSQQLEKSTNDPNLFTDLFGHKYFFGVRKISGKFQYGVSRTFTGDTYNQLDLGYYTLPNYQNTRGYFTFLWFKPWKKWLEGNFNFTVDYSQNPQNGKQTLFQLGIDAYGNRIGYNSYYFGGGYTPTSGYDYNEPRVPGRFNKTIKIWYAYVGFSTDYRKKLAVDFNFNPSNFIGKFVGEGCGISATIRYRFSDKFTLKLINSYNYDPYNLGVADYSNPDSIIYGLRIMNTYENVLSGKYIFKNDMALTLNARHYWTTGRYRKYVYLTPEGDFLDSPDYSLNNDFNYNVFNVDFVYSWQFAPGSNLSIVYKNAIETQTDQVTSGLFDDFKKTIREPQSNSISIKILYYLDYLSIRRKK